MPAEHTLSEPLAQAFNQRFHDRAALVRDRALAILRALVTRIREQGETIPDEHLVHGVDRALEAQRKKPDTNTVAYAHATARREADGAAEARIEREAAELRGRPLIPLGQPVVSVMGAPLPVGKMNPAWTEMIERAITAASLSTRSANGVRGVMACVAFGWTHTPIEAGRAIAEDLCARIADRTFNPYTWVIAELGALEQQGVQCIKPTRKWWQ